MSLPFTLFSFLEVKLNPLALIYFVALNLMCIERLYGDHGLDAVDVLRKNAPPCAAGYINSLEAETRGVG